MRYDPVQIVTNGDMSQTTIASIGIDLQNIFGYAIQAEWTGGSASGTLILQLSTDIVNVASGANPAANVVNWSTYSGSSTTVSGPGNFVWNAADAGYRWVRLLYTKSSGTGTLNATFLGKGF